MKGTVLVIGDIKQGRNTIQGVLIEVKDMADLREIAKHFAREVEITFKSIPKEKQGSLVRP